MKLKDRVKFIIFLVIFLCLALGIGIGIYYLADVVFNGSVLEWFAPSLRMTLPPGIQATPTVPTGQS